MTINAKFHIPYPRNNFMVEILPEGIGAIEKIGDYLKNISSDFNVSSEYLRCQQTTKIVSKITGFNFKNDERLNEKSEESFVEFNKRIEDFLSDIKEKNYKTVIICTHGAVIAALKNNLVNNRFRRREVIRYPRPGVLMCIEGKKVEEIDFNSP